MCWQRVPRNAFNAKATVRCDLADPRGGRERRVPFPDQQSGEFSPFDRAAPDKVSINQMFASLLVQGHTITVNSCQIVEIKPCRRGCFCDSGVKEATTVFDLNDVGSVTVNQAPSGESIVVQFWQTPRFGLMTLGEPYPVSVSRLRCDDRRDNDVEATLAHAFVLPYGDVPDIEQSLNDYIGQSCRSWW